MDHLPKMLLELPPKRPSKRLKSILVSPPMRLSERCIKRLLVKLVEKTPAQQSETLLKRLLARLDRLRAPFLEMRPGQLFARLPEGPRERLSRLLGTTIRHNKTTRSRPCRLGTGPRRATAMASPLRLLSVITATNQCRLIGKWKHLLLRPFQRGPGSRRRAGVNARRAI
jgi:hypothetical protein